MAMPFAFRQDVWQVPPTTQDARSAVTWVRIGVAPGSTKSDSRLINVNVALRDVVEHQLARLNDPCHGAASQNKHTVRHPPACSIG